MSSRKDTATYWTALLSRPVTLRAPAVAAAFCRSFEVAVICVVVVGIGIVPHFVLALRLLMPAFVVAIEGMGNGVIATADIPQGAYQNPYPILFQAPAGQCGSETEAEAEA